MKYEVSKLESDVTLETNTCWKVPSGEVGSVHVWPHFIFRVCAIEIPEGFEIERLTACTEEYQDDEGYWHKGASWMVGKPPMRSVCIGDVILVSAKNVSSEPIDFSARLHGIAA